MHLTWQTRSVLTKTDCSLDLFLLDQPETRINNDHLFCPPLSRKDTYPKEKDKTPVGLRFKYGPGVVKMLLSKVNIVTINLTKSEIACITPQVQTLVNDKAYEIHCYWLLKQQQFDFDCVSVVIDKYTTIDD